MSDTPITDRVRQTYSDGYGDPWGAMEKLESQLAEARECVARLAIGPGYKDGRWYYNGLVYPSKDKAIDAAIAAASSTGEQ